MKIILYHNFFLIHNILHFDVNFFFLKYWIHWFFILKFMNFKQDELGKNYMSL
jgi:hypothetical protein